MTIALLFIVCGALFALAFLRYGRWIERVFRMDDARKTPAVTESDGIDYIETPTIVLFGHHFSSISGAGPIVGPIIAALAFGWAPAMLWIVIGSIFFGGVHDFTALLASIRNRGQTIGRMCRDRVSYTTYILLLFFILLTLIYVIIVFLDLTATGFAPSAPPGTPGAPPDPAVSEALRQGGVVATASLAYIVLALVFGWVLYGLKIRFRNAVIIFLPLVFGALWLGHAAPLTADRLPAVFGSTKNLWIMILLLYCAVASILPVKILLQPRDVLSSFLLFACLIGGAIGLLANGFSGGAPLRYPAFIGFRDSRLGYIFPALFITVACGAISGFHSMVASGTSSRQLRSERSARVVGYGGMLTEGMLALLALATVMILSERTSDQPVAVFAAGMGRFLGALGLNPQIAATFGLLAVSTFLLTTLDTCTRLSRFVLQELLGIDGRRITRRIFSTVIVLLLPIALAFRDIPGPGGIRMPAWQAIWPAFGASNQLLAALALLVVFIWLRAERKRSAFVAIPMTLMIVTTITALAQLAWMNLARGGSSLVGWLSLILGALAIYVVASATRMIHRRFGLWGHHRKHPILPLSE